MPVSETEFIGFYPSGWTEHVHEDVYVEYVYDDDPAIIVRIDGTMGENDYTVSPITGVNKSGEEFVTRPISGLRAEEAFEIAEALVYAINGTVGRVSGDPEFNGDRE